MKVRWIGPEVSCVLRFRGSEMAGSESLLWARISVIFTLLMGNRLDLLAIK